MFTCHHLPFSPKTGELLQPPVPLAKNSGPRREGFNHVPREGCRGRGAPCFPVLLLVFLAITAFLLCGRSPFFRRPRLPRLPGGGPGLRKGMSGRAHGDHRWALAGAALGDGLPVHDSFDP